MSNAIIKGTTTNPQPADRRLQEIEFEIQYHVKRAAGHLLDVGRCLNAAKDEGLVPHGQWEEWLARNTGMSPRSAQRIMLAAREVPRESTLASLEFSKVQALLALPKDEREDFAEEADAANASVRKLEAMIKAKQRAEADAARMAETNQQLMTEQSKLRREKDKAEKELENLKRDIPTLAEELAEEYSDKLVQEIEQLREEVDRAEANAAKLRLALAESENAAPGTGISAEAQEKIDALKAELEAQEQEIARQAKLRADAQAELLRARSAAARGETGESAGGKFSADELGAAAQAFIGRASVLPYMGAQLAGLSESERAAYRKYVDMIADWCERSRAALNTLEAGAIYV